MTATPIDMQQITDRKEIITEYPLDKRISYARRNGYFLKKKVDGEWVPGIPSSQDIHVHNAWKDVKSKPRSNA
jgi:hypothetical protein